jgi:PadR family transcriptional regulator, regulatory protein PadR
VGDQSHSLQAATAGRRKPAPKNGKPDDAWRDMSMAEKKAQPGELLQGTLDLLILKALASGAMHGYAVAEWIHESSQDVLRVEEGALYPALHRLELRGLLSAEWGMSDNNRRAKYYSLTAAGRKQLAQETEYWRRMSGAVARILQTA